MHKTFEENNEFIEFMPKGMMADNLIETKLLRLVSMIIPLICIVLLTWAYFANIDEITKGEGKIISSSKNKIIDHLEGGIIKQILVKEGQLVKQGELLIKMDNIKAEADMNKERNIYYHYLAEIIKLQAIINEQPLHLPQEIIANSPEDAEEIKKAYNAKILQINNERAIIQQSIHLKKQEEQILEIKMQELEAQLQLIIQKVQTNEVLAKKKIISESQLIDLQIKASKAKVAIANNKSALNKTKAEFIQANQKLQKIKIQFKEEAIQELKKIKTLIKNTKGSLVANKDKYFRTDIISPVNGIVKQVFISTKGGVIQPGEDLIELVPLKDDLLVEAKISPKDIAFIHPDQEASVKITAYDYSIYGDLKGTVIRISADSITDENGKIFYKVFLSVKDEKLSKSKNKLTIIPGMIASVDILTGKKSILNYLLKPIIKARHEALTER